MKVLYYLGTCGHRGYVYPTNSKALGAYLHLEFLSLSTTNFPQTGYPVSLFGALWLLTQKQKVQQGKILNEVLVSVGDDVRAAALTVPRSVVGCDVALCAGDALRVEALLALVAYHHLLLLLGRAADAAWLPLQGFLPCCDRDQSRARLLFGREFSCSPQALRGQWQMPHYLLPSALVSALRRLEEPTGLTLASSVIQLRQLVGWSVLRYIPIPEDNSCLCSEGPSCHVVRHYIEVALGVSV